MGDTIASRADVARLLGRAAFGATAAQLDEWEGRPYADLVESLVAVPTAGSGARVLQPDDANRLVAEHGNNLQQGQQFWLGRMKTTLYPLEERTTLFWHDHFATAVAGQTPSPKLLLRQNETMRVNSLGSFRTMCQQLTVDGAMLQWLDGNVSTATKPNENYAREFFELFTLGTMPQVYTETDIRQAARVFTGWIVDANTLNGRYVTGRHAKDTKVVLGTTIPNLEGEEYKRLVDVALAQPVASKFVAYKLVQNFAYAPATRHLFDDPDPLVDEVAAAFVATDWNIQSAVRTMLLSDHFRHADAAAGNQLVRQPAEIVVHGAKATGVATSNASLLAPMGRCGQKLFQPPNVGGWPYGEGWLSTTTALARYSVAVTLTNVRNGQNVNLRMVFPPSSDIDSGGAAWAAHMGLDGLTPTTLAALQSYVTSRRGKPGATEAELQNGIFILLFTSPDWEVM